MPARLKPAQVRPRQGVSQGKERIRFLTIFHRLTSLRLPSLCVLALFAAHGLSALPSQNSNGQSSPSQSSQPAPPPSAPQQQPPAKGQQPPPAQQPANPFENVPENAQPNKPAAPQAQQPAATPVNANVIEDIEFRGQRRVPQDTLRALIYTKKGDVYSEESIHRDFIALWNSGRFDDLKVETERGPSGGIILRFVVTERRVVHTVDYSGNKSISKSDILDRFKDRKLGLTPESQFDPGKVQAAKNILQDFEAERGHQFATVTPQIRQVPPGGVDITFAIDEGPKVKVGTIDIEGNSAFTDREVIQAMKNLKPIGIPHSILFESLFARTYDSTKVEEDTERIRQAYQAKGYFMAHVVSHSEKIYDVQGRGIKIPLINPKKPGKRAYITMVVSEGDKYSLRNFNFVGMKLFKTPDLIARQVFGMGPGDVFSTEKLQKGLDNLKKVYGNFGYIDFVASPDPEPVPGKDQVDLTMDIDEGHQFFVRRIDFQGNTSTRDRVIRREMLIVEGDLYSTRLWETSILRINQLGFFDPLKPEDAATITRDTKTNTVDLLLKVKERGKNSIQLNGGVSQISGSFIGLSYSTNNFLGLGETLSLTSQLGTLMDNVSLGFTEPYLFDKPIQAGATVFYSRYSYNQGQQESALYGENLIGYFNQIGSVGCPASQPGCNLLNYVMNGRGFTAFSSYQLRRSFARLGLSYSWSTNSIRTLTNAANNYFYYLNFTGVGGPNALSGIRTSMITPTYAYNTVDHPIIPTHGLRISATAGVSGGVLGGNVNTIQPAVDIAYFRHGFFKTNVMGFHFAGRFISGYGGKVVPPYSRFYMGGETDVRGFDILTVSPIAFLPTESTLTQVNGAGTIINNTYVPPGGSALKSTASVTIPGYQILLPGGDTYGVFNYEYRIPIYGPVTLAYFVDAGEDILLRPDQLGLDPQRLGQLQSEFPQASFNQKAIVLHSSEKPRISTGLELQVLMPVVNAPFRLYWAYNLSYLHENIQIPISNGLSPANFASAAGISGNLSTIAPIIPYDEQHSMFRFSVGRTF